MHPIDIRKLNRWLKANVPFWAKSDRLVDRVVIFADTGRDLTPYVGGLREQFNLSEIRVWGRPNMLTIPLWQ